MEKRKIIQESFDFSDDDEEEEQVKILPSSSPIKVSSPSPSKIVGKISKYNESVSESILYATPKMATEETIVCSAHSSTSSSSSYASAPVLVEKPLPPPPPFGIVLINIKKAAEERHIQCEHQCLDDDHTPPYVALSYRWGELDEQMIPATKEYNARIISFQLQDFFKLCQAMLHEPDLKHIPYVWVDAICVNQENMEKRKATIYRMNDIYIHAAAIVAVPDLNAFHLATTTTANNDCMAIVKRYRPYLYYLLVGDLEAQQTLVDIDHAWMDTLGIPPSGSHRRDLVQKSQEQYKNKKNQKNQHKPKRQNSDNSETSNPDAAVAGDNDDNDNADPSFFIQQMMALMVTPPPPTQLQDNDDDGDSKELHAKAQHYQQLTCRMMEEFQRFEWQQKMDQRKDDIIQSMKFLQSLMEDWSSRTWVISEYHIAKRKDGKLKFWYNQLSCPELHGRRFFEFDFGKQPQPQQSLPVPVPVPAQDDGDKANDNEATFANTLRYDHPFTNQIIYLSRKFKGSMRRRLTKRSVLEMMLQTKASKHIDRFYSIIPLASKYKHHIKDRNTIAQLGISDRLSVHLKLMEWSDTKDRLNLLYCMRQPPASPFPFLPTFATRFKAIKAGLVKLMVQQSHRCNFDLRTSGGDDAVRLVRPPPVSNNSSSKDDGKEEEEEEQDRHPSKEELWLCPRVYHVPATRKSQHTMDRSFYERMGGKANKLWQELGLDPAKDTLDAVSIPLFMISGSNSSGSGSSTGGEEEEEKDLDAASKSLLASDLQLVGSWEKNVWLLHQFCSNYRDGKIHPSRVCTMDKQQLPEGFRIY